jgi:UDP-2,3-diacylglucosamine hydrolase
MFQNVQNIPLPTGKKLYFASDFHLGSPNHQESLKREKKLVRWLEMAQKDAAHIFLMGDIFDFWFEYKMVIPKGFIRFQGKLAEITDKGIPVSFFIGNHDMWMFEYFTLELGIPIYKHPLSFQCADKLFHIGHGDGLGPGDYFYKFLKIIFRSPFLQWCFGKLPPQIGMGVAHLWSRSSRKSGMKKFKGFETPEKEWIWNYCKEVEQSHPHDYYIFGHRHLVLDLPINEKSRYYNLGEWFSQYHYAVFDAENGLVLKKFEE